MTAAFTPLRGKRVRWTTILGLMLVPLTVAGLFVWGLWSPTERLTNVTAAVVNLDEPVTVDGQIVPLGRVLAAELISGGGSSPLGGSDTATDAAADKEKRTNFTWVLTNEEDAAAGVADGRFATSVTIPKDFSKAATSLSEGPKNAQAATIEIAQSDRGRLLDTALSGIVTQTATRVLNQQLGEQFVGNVFVGMSKLGDGVGEAADGATKLADGGTQLADGTKQLAEGTQQLADGTQQLASGAGQLAGGAGQLSSGAGQLVSGATGLAGGAHELATGARDAANGGSQLADGVAQYTGGVNQVLDQLISGSGQAVEPLTQLRGVVDLIPAEVFPADRPKESVLAQIDGLIAELKAASQGSDQSQMVQLRNAGAQLAAGTRASANGQAELASGLESYAGGMDQYAAGVGTYAAGVGTFANGLGSFTSGVNQLAAQTPELASGAGKLAEGAQASADGAKALATGLDQAASQIPNYTEAERKVMSTNGITPVKAEGGSDELFNAAGVPLFAGIALWAGALATFLVLSPFWSRTREAARGVFAITLRSAMPALLLGAAQGAIAGIVLPIALKYDFGQAAAFFGFAVLAGVAFGLIVQGLSARFGGFGRFIAFALLVVAFTVGIVSTVPGLLSAIGDASPIGAAFSGFQTIAFSEGSAGGAAALLVLWGLGGLALTGWAVARERRD